MLFSSLQKGLFNSLSFFKERRFVYESPDAMPVHATVDTSSDSDIQESSDNHNQMAAEELARLNVGFGIEIGEDGVPVFAKQRRRAEAVAESEVPLPVQSEYVIGTEADGTTLLPAHFEGGRTFVELKMVDENGNETVSELELTNVVGLLADAGDGKGQDLVLPKDLLDDVVVTYGTEDGYLLLSRVSDDGETIEYKVYAEKPFEVNSHLSNYDSDRMVVNVWGKGDIVENRVVFVDGELRMWDDVFIDLKVGDEDGEGDNEAFGLFSSRIDGESLGEGKYLVQVGMKDGSSLMPIEVVSDGAPVAPSVVRITYIAPDNSAEEPESLARKDVKGGFEVTTKNGVTEMVFKGDSGDILLERETNPMFGAKEVGVFGEDGEITLSVETTGDPDKDISIIRYYSVLSPPEEGEKDGKESPSIKATFIVLDETPDEVMTGVTFLVDGERIVPEAGESPIVYGDSIRLEIAGKEGSEVFSNLNDEKDEKGEIKGTTHGFVTEDGLITILVENLRPGRENTVKFWTVDKNGNEQTDEQKGEQVATVDVRHFIEFDVTPPPEDAEGNAVDYYVTKTKIQVQLSGGRPLGAAYIGDRKVSFSSSGKNGEFFISIPDDEELAGDQTLTLEAENGFVGTVDVKIQLRNTPPKLSDSEIKPGNPTTSVIPSSWEAATDRESPEGITYMVVLVPADKIPESGINTPAKLFDFLASSPNDSSIRVGTTSDTDILFTSLPSGKEYIQYVVANGGSTDDNDFSMYDPLEVATDKAQTVYHDNTPPTTPPTVGGDF